MRKVKIEQGSVIDSDLDHNISSEQPFSLQKSEPMPKEAVSRYWSRKQRRTSCKRGEIKIVSELG